MQASTSERRDDRLVALQSLIEKQTTYEQMFARTALVGGLLSTAVAIVASFWPTARLLRGREFAFLWLAVFAVNIVIAIIFARRTSGRASDRIGAVRSRFVFGALAPFSIIPAAYTLWFLATGYFGGVELDLVTIWIASYALMLLATSSFAPRSVPLLGWIFLIAALCVPVVGGSIQNSITNVPLFLTGTTFGGLRLVYALIVWARLRAATN